jgi:hypothetical protein
LFEVLPADCMGWVQLAIQKPVPKKGRHRGPPGGVDEHSFMQHARRSLCKYDQADRHDATLDCRILEAGKRAENGKGSHDS